MTTIAAPTDDLLSAATCLIVANPAAAGVTPEIIAEVADRLAGRADGVRTALTASAGDGTRIGRDALAAGVDIVVTLGGDGTVNEVVQALAGRAGAPVLCPLPLGSGNSTSRMVLGDRDWRAALDLLEQPGAVRPRAIDLLYVREATRHAVLGASTGFLAQVLADAARVDPAVHGIDRYYTAAATLMAAMPAQPTRVTVDGVVLRDAPLCSVAIGGGRFRARSFQFLPESILDDGLLDVSTIDAVDGAGVAELAPRMPDGDHLALPYVRYARGRQVIVERTDGRPLMAEWDGTVWATPGSRLTLDIRPLALRTLAARDADCG